MTHEVIINMENILIDEEREKKWESMNTPDKDLGCSECVWGIQSMNHITPIYCSCVYGRQHKEPQQPWLASLGERFILFLRKIGPFYEESSLELS
jgi:hypothetical protein